jgi:hypothetical protein
MISLGIFLFFFGKVYINKENSMNRLYEIVNYSNNHLFDLYEINEKRQKYKRFRIQKPELMKLLSPDEAKLLEKENEYADLFANPYIAAQRGFIDEVILPQDTRRKLIKAFSMLENKVSVRPNRKHGNIPL